MEFLQKLAVIFNEYGGCTNDNLEDNYFVLYQILEEICDGGIPLTTDLSILSAIIPKARSYSDTQSQFLNNISKAQSIGKVSSMQSNIVTDLPPEALSSISWRPTNVSHMIQTVAIANVEIVNVV